MTTPEISAPQPAPAPTGVAISKRGEQFEHDASDEAAAHQDAAPDDEMDRQLEEAWSENEALKDEVAVLQRDLARAHDSAHGFTTEINLLKKQVRELRAFQVMVNRHAPEFPADPDGSRDVWYWQGDGEDHLESMTHQLPVVIRAEQLRELMAAAAIPAPEGAELPPLPEITDADRLIFQSPKNKGAIHEQRTTSRRRDQRAC